MTDETVYRAMLFDFFGGLLTEKQREYYDLHYNDDLSLAEIAETAGISRQGVWDIIKRADESLRDTEERTGIVARHIRWREAMTGARRDLAELAKNPSPGVRAAAMSALGKLEAIDDTEPEDENGV